MLYNSLNTIIQIITITSSGIQGIQVHFNQATTMNGKSRLVSFLTSQRCRFLLSIASPLLLAATIQNIKSKQSITVRIINHSPLIEKYSNIQAIDRPHIIPINAHSPCVITLEITVKSLFFFVLININDFLRKYYSGIFHSCVFI